MLNMVAIIMIHKSYNKIQVLLSFFRTMPLTLWTADPSIVPRPPRSVSLARVRGNIIPNPITFPKADEDLQL